MGERITATDYFAAFLTAAHLAFCARDIAALAVAESFRFGRFPGSVPIGTTGSAGSFSARWLTTPAPTPLHVSGLLGIDEGRILVLD
jgi:hypothetical protein